MVFEHYLRLLHGALRLTGNNHPEAEDLVQELYLRFARLGVVPPHVDNAESYLFSVLRNPHYAHLRRARVSAIDGLSIVNYESAERTVRAVDRNGALFVRADLHRVCAYLCARKQASRSASVFILRSFLGYFPSEVMKVAKATRGAVDKAVQAARGEARVDLERPGSLRHFSVGQKEPSWSLRTIPKRFFALCVRASSHPAWESVSGSRP